MTFIQLNKDGFIIKANGTLYTITRKSLNFNKIAKLLSAEKINKEEILNLLKPEKLIDGIHEAYLCPASKVLIDMHYDNKGVPISTFLGDIPPTTSLENCTFLGVYRTRKDIMADWPEYSL